MALHRHTHTHTHTHAHKHVQSTHIHAYIPIPFFHTPLHFKTLENSSESPCSLLKPNFYREKSNKTEVGCSGVQWATAWPLLLHQPTWGLQPGVLLPVVGVVGGIWETLHPLPGHVFATPLFCIHSLPCIKPTRLLWL